MNLYNLLESKNLDISNIVKTFKEKNFNYIYNQYKEAVDELLFISNTNEFDDFINEQGELKEEPFLLEFAYKKGVCCNIGMYDENANDILSDYINRHSNINVNLHYSYDEINHLKGDIININELIKNTNKRYLVLLDDTYCEGSYYIFIIDEKFDDKQWESHAIARII
ncbi:hypothetical protein LAD12857_17420 [Lacrimispora amygdalina]|uniref:Uncharacterized protein n=1 Tax=Lacrimispora amygdalina TaxID=253257 RepID=A0ABQ5M4D2_9FIRM